MSFQPELLLPPVRNGHPTSSGWFVVETDLHEMNIIFWEDYGEDLLDRQHQVLRHAPMPDLEALKMQAHHEACEEIWEGPLSDLMALALRFEHIEDEYYNSRRLLGLKPGETLVDRVRELVEKK